MGVIVFPVDKLVDVVCDHDSPSSHPVSLEVRFYDSRIVARRPLLDSHGDVVIPRSKK